MNWIGNGRRTYNAEVTELQRPRCCRHAPLDAPRGCLLVLPLPPLLLPLLLLLCAGERGGLLRRLREAARVHRLVRPGFGVLGDGTSVGLWAYRVALFRSYRPEAAHDVPVCCVLPGLGLIIAACVSPPPTHGQQGS